MAEPLKCPECGATETRQGKKFTKPIQLLRHRVGTHHVDQAYLAKERGEIPKKQEGPKVPPAFRGRQKEIDHPLSGQLMNARVTPTPDGAYKIDLLTPGGVLVDVLLGVQAVLKPRHQRREQRAENQPV